MARDPRAYLWDASEAAKAIASFTDRRTLQEYEADIMLRSAVERQFEIVGEALNQLAKVSPDLAVQIGDLPRIVAFRNILIHRYAAIDPISDRARRR
jgi:uncharacterized protein with HEPN domain